MNDFSGFDFSAFDPQTASTPGFAGDLVDANVDPSTLVNPTSFNVGPGQVPSDIYNQLVNSGALVPGANVPTIQTPGGGGTPTPAHGQQGLITNPDGSINWASLLGMLAPLAGGLYTASQTHAAQQQMLNAINNANTAITGTLGGNAALYQPYRNVGQQGLNALSALPQSNLAAKFPALGTPAPGFSLGTIARKA